jgi:hypothetical protein
MTTSLEAARRRLESARMHDLSARQAADHDGAHDGFDVRAKATPRIEKHHRGDVRCGERDLGARDHASPKLLR